MMMNDDDDDDDDERKMSQLQVFTETCKSSIM